LPTLFVLLTSLFDVRTRSTQKSYLLVEAPLVSINDAMAIPSRLSVMCRSHQLYSLQHTVCPSLCMLVILSKYDTTIQRIFDAIASLRVPSCWEVCALLWQKEITCRYSDIHDKVIHCNFRASSLSLSSSSSSHILFPSQKPMTITRHQNNL